MARTSLGDLERLVLLAVVRLGDGTYGAEVQREIRAHTGRAVTPGTVYPTLDRLERKGLLSSWTGDATAERGGRAKRHYRVRPEGLALAARAWQEMRSLADGIEDRLGIAADS
jgi:DNA-binding PadR family transcriptional regulator